MFAESIFDKTTVVSSAYCKTFVSLLPILIPSISGSLRIEIAKVSMTRRKRYGESGSHCLTPCARVKEFDAKPLFITQLSIL